MASSPAQRQRPLVAPAALATVPISPNAQTGVTGRGATDQLTVCLWFSNRLSACLTGWLVGWLAVISAMRRDAQNWRYLVMEVVERVPGRRARGAGTEEAWSQGVGKSRRARDGDLLDTYKIVCIWDYLLSWYIAFSLLVPGYPSIYPPIPASAAAPFICTNNHNHNHSHPNPPHKPSTLRLHPTYYYRITPQTQPQPRPRHAPETPPYITARDVSFPGRSEACTCMHPRPIGVFFGGYCFERVLVRKPSLTTQPHNPFPAKYVVEQTQPGQAAKRASGRTAKLLYDERAG
ncbi:uncharacterized protein K452DRAFT_308366 [Aplosporella prunicola CBS 121167]|uniref:Uncharacterized protein n=1 Tax=Aplosporella prunicola CBS 121167 TaxID=1176127 RepID=A0A6A6BGF3_9PEZI|nr:uncharacterized protein K452DRAFT_308366 [Aplosporella prunicola CBS 121167]KAF2141947.1 hypothetical protein K452DRAFT_308366 [Aplosporella prunicola CBS 121167]